VTKVSEEIELIEETAGRERRSLSIFSVKKEAKLSAR